MFINLVRRIALLTIACASLSQASTVNLGYITFNSTTDTGPFTIFNIYNYTNLVGDAEYPVMTPVNFLTTSLEIDRLGQAGQPVAIDSPILPDPDAYDSDPIGPNYVISRAVFRATIDPATPWTLFNGQLFVPNSSQLEIVLLPANGTHMVANQETWYINVANSGVNNPEPATFLISGIALAGVAALRRRFALRS
ncbi:MAG TPA: PEP-CTERM sorting domain-containing protein [Bryobacteraceae bacterium]|nr:PEP-CTERM sorting domain-containing protein [Bryobacteraceae bacterium]